MDKNILKKSIIENERPKISEYKKIKSYYNYLLNEYNNDYTSHYFNFNFSSQHEKDRSMLRLVNKHEELMETKKKLEDIKSEINFEDYKVNPYVVLKELDKKLYGESDKFDKVQDEFDISFIDNIIARETTFHGNKYYIYGIEDNYGRKFNLPKLDKIKSLSPTENLANLFKGKIENDCQLVDLLDDSLIGADSNNFQTEEFQDLLWNIYAENVIEKNGVNHTSDLEKDLWVFTIKK